MMFGHFMIIEEHNSITAKIVISQARCHYLCTLAIMMTVQGEHLGGLGARAASCHVTSCHVILWLPDPLSLKPRALE